MMRESVSELLTRIDKIEDKASQVEELKKAGNGRLEQFLQIALHPNVVFLLPEGEPPYKPGTGVTDHGAFWQEIRRLPTFCRNGPYPNLKQGRREEIFIDMLESIHPDDAKILIAIKDRKWPFLNISDETVAAAFPGLIDA